MLAAVTDSNLTSNLRKRWRQVLDPVLIAGGILVIWEVGIVVFDVPSIILPPPSVIYDSLIQFNSQFINEGITSLQFIVVSFVLGSLLGIFSAFVLYFSEVLYRILFPVLVIGFVIPKIALAPLLMLYLGVESSYYILLPVTFVYFPVLENALSGLRGVDDDLLDLTSIYHPSRWFKFRHVQVPYALPYIGAGAKIGVTQATIGVILAEILAPNQGLGSLLMLGNSYHRPNIIFASIFAIGIAGIFIYKVVEIIERRLIFWRDIGGGGV